MTISTWQEWQELSHEITPHGQDRSGAKDASFVTEKWQEWTMTGVVAHLSLAEPLVREQRL